MQSGFFQKVEKKISWNFFPFCIDLEKFHCVFLSLIELFEFHIFKYLYFSAQKLHEESEDQQGAKQPVEEFESQEGEQALVSLE